MGMLEYVCWVVGHVLLLVGGIFFGYCFLG